jgi:hypothetical protein
MFLNVKEATILIKWTVATSSIYQTEEQRGLNVQRSLAPTFSDPAKKIVNYALEVLRDYDSSSLKDGEAKNAIDLALMFGNLKTELHNIERRIIHSDEIQKLYNRIHGAIQKGSKWSEGMGLLAKAVELYSKDFSFPLSRAPELDSSSDEGNAVNVEPPILPSERDTSSDEGDIPPPCPEDEEVQMPPVEYRATSAVSSGRTTGVALTSSASITPLSCVSDSIGIGGDLSPMTEGNISPFSRQSSPQRFLPIQRSFSPPPAPDYSTPEQKGIFEMDDL